MVSTVKDSLCFKPLPVEGSISYQLVGEVTAHQGYDGYPALAGGRAHWD